MADARTIIKQLLDDEAESAKYIWPGNRDVKYLFTHRTTNVYNRSERIEYHVFVDESGELFAHRPIPSPDLGNPWYGRAIGSIAHHEIVDAYQAYLDNQ